MFREFIYLDIDRIQSIIAQLQEGLLTDTASGKQDEVSSKTGVSGQLFVPVTAEIQGKSATDYKATKIPHDYAFNLAFKSLRHEGLILESVDDFERESFPIPENAFILTKGRPKLYDFSALIRVWDRKWQLDHGSDSTSTTITKRQRHSGRHINENKGKTDEGAGPNQVRALFETFYNDAILISLTNSLNVAFMGLLYRQHLREDIRSLIFKYGARPQGAWTMLAQVCSIPERKETSVAEETAHITEALENLLEDNDRNWSEYITDLLERLNEFQEQMGTVVFPNISVSPIAIYREISSLQ